MRIDRDDDNPHVNPRASRFLCVLVSVSLGLLFSILLLARSAAKQPTLLTILIDLARDPSVASLHASIADSLKHVADHKDPIFRQLALSRLEGVARDCRLLGNATVEFLSTESWRVVYEELLRSPGLHLYRSVAYVESADYWQDAPGEQSTQLNLQLHDSGIVRIERTVVIADHLWPESSLFPVEPLCTWLDRHHRHGIWLRLVRESSLANDPDLFCDCGIYGNRAVGIQSADPQGQTIKFTLCFDFAKVQEAEEKWNRLAVYAVSYRDLLDQQHGS